MPDDPGTRLSLRQVDQLRTDIANLEGGQEFLMQLINRLPTRADLARATLGGTFCTAVLVLLGIAVFWPHGL
jgi:hypothetical protein